MKIPAPFWNLLKRLGKESEKMHWTTISDSRYGTPKLSEDEIEKSEKLIDYLKEKRVLPIIGYILEMEKGSFFIHDSGRPWEIVRNDSTLTPK
jgi:hypothetical protein